jgi:DNA-directed RNA polymerase specialized sigma24 family protein
VDARGGPQRGPRRTQVTVPARRHDDVDFDAHVDADQRSPQDRLESAERVSRSTEALRGLKPDEARALLLKAEDLSYTEIDEQLTWSYTCNAT